jgi:hypothetical protein
MCCLNHLALTIKPVKTGIRMGVPLKKFLDCKTRVSQCPAFQHEQADQQHTAISGAADIALGLSTTNRLGQ